MLASLLRFVRWVWRFGDAASPVPVYAIAVACMLGTLLHRTIHDVDIFWQLKLGEIILADGLPANEPFLAGRQHEPLAVVGWLGQVVFAAVRLIGGWDLLRLFDALIWLGGFVVVGWSITRETRNHWPVVIGLWVGWFAAVPFASIRPQSFAVFAFGLLVVANRMELRDRTKVAVCTALLILWQNLHPSAAVGAVYLTAAAAAEWGLYFLGRGLRPGYARLILVPIAALATLATPAGLDIYRISAANRDRCMSDLLRITEWLPMWELWPEVGRAEATPMMIATLVLILIRGRRTHAADLLPMLALFAMTVLTFRFVLFWGVAVIPIWAQCLSPASNNGPVSDLSSATRKVRRAVAAAALLLALTPLRIWPLNFIDYYPFKGCAALKAEQARGTVYTNYFWGGVVTDRCYPDWHPTHDGRYYIFTQQELEDHVAAGSGGSTVEDLERQFDPVAFFLRPGSAGELDSVLIERLRANPRWREVFADSNSVVFVKW